MKSLFCFSFISISVITLPHSFVMTNFTIKINNMLFSVNDDSIDLENLIDNRCGRVYSFIERIRKQIFGSSKYELVSIYPEKNLSLDNFSDSIYLNFDLRFKGLVFYFRYKNTEYVSFVATIN